MPGTAFPAAKPRGFGLTCRGATVRGARPRSARLGDPATRRASADSRVPSGERPSASLGASARQRGERPSMGVASGPETRHMRRYLPRRDPHGMKANMGSANHASACGVGYFPPRAIPATCGIGVRPRAASCVSMSVPRTARGRSKPSKGFVAKAIDEGEATPAEHVDPRVEQLLRRLHARTLESPSPASQPVGNSLLSQSVPSCVRTSQRTRRLPPVARPNTPAERACSEKLRVCGRHRSTRIAQPKPVYRTPRFDDVDRPREPVRSGIF